MSSSNQPAPVERQKLDFDFDDEPVADSKAEVIRKVEEISERSGFTARSSAPRQPVAAKPVITKRADAVPKKERRVRMKTGRTYSFSTKLKEETYHTLCGLADKATTKEGRPVSIAEIIERGTALLDKDMKA